MSKAILVIDNMPNTCEECELKYLDTGDDAYFGPNVFRCVIDGSEICKDDRHYDCPLKPIPEKELIWNDDDDYQMGWNDCIDEILGEEE